MQLQYTNPLTPHHSRGQRARQEENCCWFFEPVYRRWRPVTGKEIVPVHTARNTMADTETKRKPNDVR